jgi:hypothetical protein
VIVFVFSTILSIILCFSFLNSKSQFLDFIDFGLDDLVGGGDPFAAGAFFAGKYDLAQF